ASRGWVGRHRAGENRHERALAGAVLADESAHFSVTNRQIDAIERTRGAERLADAAHLEAGRYGFSHRFRSGCSSSWRSGSSRWSRDTSRTPVSMRGSTFSPRRWATMVFTPR